MSRICSHSVQHILYCGFSDWISLKKLKAQNQTFEIAQVLLNVG